MLSFIVLNIDIQSYEVIKISSSVLVKKLLDLKFQMQIVKGIQYNKMNPMSRTLKKGYATRS